MVKTIIFDIGQVLVQFRWREYIKELGFDEHTTSKLEKATVLSHWWPEIDRGMEKEEYESGMKAEHPDLVQELETFFANTRRIVEPYEYSERLVRNLKEKGYRVYLLSNYGDYLYHESAHRFLFRNYVDGELISYEIHSIKPEVRIYEALFERYQIRPEEAVFIDDKEDNIKAAKGLGLNTILFTDYHKMKIELEKYGVDVEGI